MLGRQTDIQDAVHKILAAVGDGSAAAG